MKKQAALGTKHLNDVKQDNDDSGAAGVGAAPNGGEDKPLTKEQLMAQGRADAKAAMNKEDK